MKYYYWVEGGKIYRSYLSSNKVVIVEVEDESTESKNWKEIHHFTPRSVRAVLNLAKIDPDVARLGEG